MLFRRALLLGTLAIAALPTYAATILVRSGSITGGGGGSWTTGAGPVQAVVFTLASGNPYFNVNITAALCSTSGVATGTAYLINTAVSTTGSGLPTSANQVAPPVSISTSKSCTDPTAISAPLQIFSNVTLPAGTYSVVVFDSNSSLGWIFSDPATFSQSLGTGVTTTNDFLASTAAGYPPGSTFSAIGSPNPGILLSVTGTAGTPPPPTGVPTLGAFGVIGTGVLLGFAGLLFLKREAVPPLR